MAEKVKAALKVSKREFYVKTSCADYLRANSRDFNGKVKKLILNLFLLQASKKLDDPTRCDILELLGQLEGELQAKDIAIATLKVSRKI